LVNVLDKWINEIGQDFFKKNLGIKPGQKILDFGCGWGGNAIAISKIVVPDGYVYAFEKDRDSINKMLRIADESSKKNLKVIIGKEKISTPINDSELDIALLYDVIHDSYFNSHERKILFREVRRIVKKGGLLSVFPHHISSDEIEIIKKELYDAGFKYSNKITSTIIHDSILILDSVYNFNKN
jgi:ubiquinone/menaquinone biosynthesis C-methylase UbiE